MVEGVAIFAAGVVSGALNALAGGGSLVSFPTLVATGLPELSANATNTAAQWPGSLASASGYRERVKEHRRLIGRMAIPTIAGALVGAQLLLFTPTQVFRFLIPVLILVATVSLLIPKKSGENQKKAPEVWGQVTQFFISLYGGYFGAGMGIMMLSSYRHWMEGELHDHNAVKNALAVLINLAATVLLWFGGTVIVVPMALLMAGSICGGYVCSRWIQRVQGERLRGWIVAFGFAMAVWFTIRLF